MTVGAARLGVAIACAGCRSIFGFESAVGVDASPIDSPAEQQDAPVDANVFARSFAAQGAGKYAEAFVAQLGSEDPDATIHVTTDGSLPTLASPAMTTANFQSTIPVRFFAETSTGIEPVNSVTYTVDVGEQAEQRFVVTEVDLDTSSAAGPVVVVAPGATLNAAATIKRWSQSACPGCIIQIVPVIGDAGTGCATNDVAGLFPGKTTVAAPFTLTAPSVPGTYPVDVALIEQFTCPDAITDFDAAPNGFPRRQIGVLVVR